MTTNTNTAQILPQVPKSRSRSSEKKWGKGVMELGFSVLPSLIFKAQARLGLSPVQLIVLLHLADYWWDKERLPCPSKATLGERMNLSPRQIQRYLTELEKAAFIKRVERFAGHNGQQSNEYDLSGLVARLQELEPEFREVKELNKRVAKRGGLDAIQKAQDGQ